ncbi:MAG: hypothetical protein DDG60_05505 [Anaerolineae bacterium]|nr:MAG: hypothetical protein DDG60_05505 [Anaerolineae bacterium]
MLFDTRLFVGIDPCGASKPFTWAALDKSGRLVSLQQGELEDALAFVSNLPSVVVAVNAPQRPSAGLVRQQVVRRGAGRSFEMRVAEYLLRERGMSVSLTPSRRELCANWTQLGFAFYERLEKAGFQPYSDTQATHLWMETQAHAVFCVLLGQVPLPRPTIEGRLQRQLILYEQGLGIRDPMEYFEEVTRHKLLKGMLPLEQVYTPEQLDALAAAGTACWVIRSPERVTRLGDPHEGHILLPVAELKERYK